MRYFGCVIKKTPSEIHSKSLTYIYRVSGSYLNDNRRIRIVYSCVGQEKMDQQHNLDTCSSVLFISGHMVKQES